MIFYDDRSLGLNEFFLQLMNSNIVIFLDWKLNLTNIQFNPEITGLNTEGNKG